MSTINDGGPAFPIPGLHDDEDFNGMTLRDYFAANAMQGLLSDSTVKGAVGDFAKRSYAMADAMLLARQS